MIDLLSRLLPCRHSRITRPFTLGGKGGLGAKNTYVVCLGCGRHLGYDWERMRMVKRVIEPARDSQPLGARC